MGSATQLYLRPSRDSLAFCANACAIQVVSNLPRPFTDSHSAMQVSSIAACSSHLGRAGEKIDLCVIGPIHRDVSQQKGFTAQANCRVS